MPDEYSEASLHAILECIASSPEKLSAGDLPGDKKTNLLVIRELRRRGLIKGIFENDYGIPRDQHGHFLDEASSLELL